MISVAHFRDILFKPTETFLYNYIKAFHRTAPICVTFQRENPDLFPFDGPLLELYSGSKRKRLLHKLIQVISPQRLQSWNPAKLLRWHYDHRQTVEMLQHHNAQVLHAHFGYTGSALLPVKLKTGLPLVTTFYGADVSAMAVTELQRAAYVPLFAEGDLFLVEGPHMRQRLTEIGCPSNKIAIQRIAIHIENYFFRPRGLDLANRRIRILFCGSFREKKGLAYALAAVKHVHREFPNLEFRIIGDGELRPQIQQIIEQNDMCTYTHLLGFQTHEQVIREMDKADLFIHPSIAAADGDTEGGAPTIILEAQASGLPIISTTHADIPNVVVPNISALLAPERDSETLAANLLTLLNEPNKWAEMGAAGRAFVEKYHDVTVEVNQLEDRYFEIYRSTGSS